MAVPNKFPTAPKPSTGGKPSQPQKLIYVADKLGLSGLKDMQGSSVNIVDTVPLATNTGRQILSFFSQSANKSRNFSNFQNGSLKAGEAMVIEELAFFLVVATNADLTSDANAILTLIPVSLSSATAYPNKQSFNTGLINITIANSKVVKDFSAFEQDPAFNQNASGMTSFDTATATNVRTGPAKIRLESPPVLPPNQALSITLEIPPTGTIPAFSNIMCIAGRFGSIFAGKTTL